MKIHIQVIAANNHQLEIQHLYNEYVKSLGINLKNSRHVEILEKLQTMNTAANYWVYIALVKGEPAGCIILNKLTDTKCELKHLYVRPKFQGFEIGKQLCLKVISEAKIKTFQILFIDTFRKLTEQIALYKTLGFTKATPYYNNPLKGTVFMEYNLVTDNVREVSTLQIAINILRALIKQGK